MTSSRGFSVLLKSIDMNIGFIGAGNLALYMAQGLVRSGWYFIICYLVYMCIDQAELDVT